MENLPASPVLYRVGCRLFLIPGVQQLDHLAHVQVIVFYPRDEHITGAQDQPLSPRAERRQRGRLQIGRCQGLEPGDRGFPLH